ncbi:MAG: hypothetical protein CM15mP125_4260 [Gammaproteobacteria bacterium]|nr:MAG: hypothetical protein CM15mP125_4260 [Gammaproteobacteria bacterium]
MKIISNTCVSISSFDCLPSGEYQSETQVTTPPMVLAVNRGSET